GFAYDDAYRTEYFSHPRLNCRKIMRIMKIILILLTVTLTHVYSNSYSQKVTLSGRNLPLEKFFPEIKEQTGYVFFYDSELFKTARPVTLKVSNAEFLNVLVLLFNDQPLEYTIENRTIVISKKNGTQLTTNKLVIQKAIRG